MADDEYKNGTWTLRVKHQRKGVWTAWLDREACLNPRFQLARFDLANDRFLLVSAEQLRAAIRRWLDDPDASTIQPTKIDPLNKTVDGVPVEMSYEV